MASTFSSVASVGIQNSTLIPEHILAPMIVLTEDTRPFMQEILGFGDVNREVMRIKGSEYGMYKEASSKVGLDFYTSLGVTFPKRARYLKEGEENALVIRHQDVPDEYTFRTADNHTGGATTYTWRMQNPGELISINAVFRYEDDNVALNTVIVTDVTPESDNGAIVKVDHLAGANGNITNSSGSEKKIYLVGVYNSETGDCEIQKYRPPTSETFGTSIIETPISISSKAELTKFKTQDEMTVAMTYKLAKNALVRKELNNTLVYAPSITGVTLKNGNAINIVPGLTEMSGIGTASASVTGLGPTVIETVLANITRDACEAVPFVRVGKRPVLQAFFGRTIQQLFNNMLSRSAAPFGTSLQTKFGEDTYDKNLRTWKGITADMQLFYDRSFDNAFLDDKILVVNKNAVVVIFKQDQFMRVAPNPSKTTHRVKTWVCTNEVGLCVLVKTHVYLISGATALET